SGVRIEEFKERLRTRLPEVARQRPPAMKDVRLSFEAGDIVAQVMSFGSPTPVEGAVSGPKMDDKPAYAQKGFAELKKIPSLRDLQIAQSLDYPALVVELDRELLGRSGATVSDVAASLPPVTLSSRFISRNFWRDPKSGLGYQVQVQLAAERINSAEDVRVIPISKPHNGGKLLLRDVAHVGEGTMPGQVDRYNMMRLISMTANGEGEDLGRVAGRIESALKAAGKAPTGVQVEVRGQVVPMREMFTGLAAGLVLSVVAILLLLTANFQSPRLALAVVSTVPAVLTGVVLALVVTGTTPNIHSFMGAIMAIGLAVANATL